MGILVSVTFFVDWPFCYLHSSKKLWEYNSYLPSVALGRISREWNWITSLEKLVFGFMLVFLATKPLATSWGDEMPQGLLPTRAVQQGSEKCGICRHRGTAPGNRGGMCTFERVNILKDPCLLQHSLLHSLNLPVRGAAFLPFQRWAGGSKAKAASVSLKVFLWLEVALHVTYPLSKTAFYIYYSFGVGYF